MLASGVRRKLGAIVSGDQLQARGSGNNSSGLLQNLMLFLSYAGDFKKKKYYYKEREGFLIFKKAWV